jgi:hypothetical protein
VAKNLDEFTACGCIIETLARERQAELTDDRQGTGLAAVGPELSEAADLSALAGRRLTASSPQDVRRSHEGGTHGLQNMDGEAASGALADGGAPGN